MLSSQLLCNQSSAPCQAMLSHVQTSEDPEVRAQNALKELLLTLIRMWHESDYAFISVDLSPLRWDMHMRQPVIHLYHSISVAVDEGQIKNGMVRGEAGLKWYIQSVWHQSRQIAIDSKQQIIKMALSFTLYNWDDNIHFELTCICSRACLCFYNYATLVSFIVHIILSDKWSIRAALWGQTWQSRLSDSLKVQSGSRGGAWG